MQPLAFVAKVKRSLMRKTCSRSCDLRSNGSAQCETGWASLRRDPDAAEWPVQIACLLRTRVVAFPKILIRNLLLVNACFTYLRCKHRLWPEMQKEEQWEPDLQRLSLRSHTGTSAAQCWNTPSHAELEHSCLKLASDDSQPDFWIPIKRETGKKNISENIPAVYPYSFNTFRCLAGFR